MRINGRFLIDVFHYLLLWIVWIHTVNICDSAIPGEVINLAVSGKLDLPEWRCQERNLKNYLCPLNEAENNDCDLVNILVNRINKNYTEKIKIVHHLLTGTCSSFNDTKTYLDINSLWTEKVLKNFITQAAFNHQNGLYIFLSRVIQSNNVESIKDFKIEIEKQLENVMTCYNTPLLNDTRTWITSHLIYPLIPNMKDTASIYAVDYLYAMAGKIFIEACQLNMPDVSVEELIQLSTGIQYFAGSKNTDKAAFSIFALPVLLHYTHALVDNNTIALDFANKIFKWNVAHKEVFSNFEKMEYETYAQYKAAVDAYRNRSHLAADFIQKFCKNYNLEDEIVRYKNQGKKYRCTEGDITAEFPDITELFEKELADIAEKYRRLEEMIIIKLLRHRGDIVYIANSTTQKAFIYKPKTDSIAAYHTREMTVIYDHRLDHLLDETVDVPANTKCNAVTFVFAGVFGVRQTNYEEWKFYAVLRENGSMRIISYDENNPKDFLKNVMRKALNDKVVDIHDNFTIYSLNKNLKGPGQNITVLARSIASERAENLHESLYRSGFMETGWEKFIRILLSFIPFHNCYKQIVTSQYTGAFVDCSLDVLAFIPVFGEVAGIGLKVFEEAALTAVRTMAVKQDFYLTLRSVITEAALSSSKSFTRTNFKNVGISLLRAFDPGFELMFVLSKNILFYLAEIGHSLPIFQRVVNELQLEYSKTLQQLNLNDELKVINENKLLTMKNDWNVLNAKNALSECRRTL